MTAAEFDTAIAALRRVVVGGENLPSLAHASGRPTAHFAAGLHAFLRDLDHAVHVAHRTEKRVLTCGARDDPNAVVDLPPGWKLVSRAERAPAPVRGERTSSAPLVLHMTARGEVDEVEGLPPGYTLSSPGGAP